MSTGSHRVVVLLALLAMACSTSRTAPVGVAAAECVQGFHIAPAELRAESAPARPGSPAQMRAAHLPAGTGSPGRRQTTSDEEAASQEPRVWYGAESRSYPAGWIGTFLVERPVDAQETVLLMAGANHTDRDDFGERDDEEGSGYGAGVGYRRYLGEQLDGWFVGARLELWMLTIDWTDHPGKPNKKTGTTDVWVLQPTAELGYGFRLGERSRLNAFVSAGAEINVHTSGKSVGEGPIGLVGLSWVYGF